MLGGRRHVNEILRANFPRFVATVQLTSTTGRAVMDAMTTRNAPTSTHERILQRGLALMSQSGLSGVTLGVLADQVGMSKSGLFAHFRSKEDVQVELLTHMAEFATEPYTLRLAP